MPLIEWHCRITLGAETEDDVTPGIGRFSEVAEDEKYLVRWDIGAGDEDMDFEACCTGAAYVRGDCSSYIELLNMKLLTLKNGRFEAEL